MNVATYPLLLNLLADHTTGIYQGQSTQGGSRTHTHIVHYDLNVARLPIPALGYENE